MPRNAGLQRGKVPRKEGKQESSKTTRVGDIRRERRGIQILGESPKEGGLTETKGGMGRI